MGIASAYGYLREACGLCRCCGKDTASEEMNKSTPPQRPPLQYSDECWTAPLPDKSKLTDLEKLRRPFTESKVPTKVTLEDIEANIIGEYYFSAADGARFGWLTSDHANVGVRGRVRSIADSIPTSSHASTSASIDANADTHPALSLLTFCVLVLRNGFVVTGESSCVSPETFNTEVGREVARENAINKIWPLMGYELRTKLSDKN